MTLLRKYLLYLTLAIFWWNKITKQIIKGLEAKLG